MQVDALGMPFDLSQSKAQMQLTFLLMPRGWPYHISCRSVALQCKPPSVGYAMQHRSAGPMPCSCQLCGNLGLASNEAVKG